MLKKLSLLSLLSLLLIGCTIREHTQRAIGEWGRGRLLGFSSGPSEIGLLPLDDGVAIAFPSRAGDSGPMDLRLMRLDAEGAVATDLALDVPTDEPRGVRLAQVDDGLLLTWYEGFNSDRALNIVTIDAAGVVQQPVQTVANPAGIVWYKTLSHDGGTQLVVLDGEGSLTVRTISAATIAAPTDLLANALQADVQIDNAGQIHVSWTEQINELQRVINYALVVDGVVSTPVEIGVFGVPEGDNRNQLDGPVVALDETHLYIAWARRQTTPGGLVARTYYVAAPLSGGAAPTFAEETLVGVLGQFPPLTATQASVFQVSELAQPFEELFGTTTGLTAPEALPGQNGEAVLAFSMNLSTRSRNSHQPTLVYLKGGEQLGYQTLTWTDRTSRRVRVAADATQHLYTTWHDAPSGRSYPIYLMTTQPEIQAAGNRLSLNDIGSIIIDMIGRIGNGASLTLIAAAWPIGSFIFLFLAFWFSNGELYDRRGFIVLGISVLIYLAMKYFFLNDITSYIPGATFMDPRTARAAILVTPLLITVLSSLLTYVLYLRRVKGDLNVMRAYLQIVLLDFAVSMSIYSIGRFE